MKDASQQTKPEIWAGALTRPSREAADRGNLEGGTTSNSAEMLPVGEGEGQGAHSSRASSPTRQKLQDSGCAGSRAADGWDN